VSVQTVRDLVRIRHSHVVPESTGLREVAERLMISDCDLVAVTDDDGRLTGILCESAVVRALLSHRAAGVTIQSIVTRHAISTRLDAELSAVLPLFRTSACTAIPVVDEDGRVFGLLMRRDVIGTLLNRESGRQTAGSATGPQTTAPAPSAAQESSAARKLTIESAESSTETVARHNGPHFLRADAARRILWSAEDRL
jgi:CBS domain-containing protein